MKDGTGTTEPPLTPTSFCTNQRVTLYADRAATVAMLRARLPRMPNCPAEVIFVATRDHPADVEKQLGPLAAFLGHTAYLDATLDATPPTGTLDVRTVADDAIAIDGTRVTLPVAAGSASETAASSRTSDRIQKIHYTFRPADTIDQVVRAMVAAETLYEARLSAWDLQRVVTIDDGTAPAAAPSGSIGLGLFGTGGVTAGPPVRQGSVTVNGRLPPEVVQRIVRQNFGRFRLCYERGLKANPTLSGGVTVKFVIDRTGDVTKSSDAGSDLPDKGVVACVVSGFSKLSFPAPEGGIVSVVYPLSFAPAP
jgi:hypothetical protein